MEKTYHIVSDSGIHARPASLLVQKAAAFQADITLTYQNKSVNMKSIMGVMSLGIGKGADITIKIEGIDEDEALVSVEGVLQKEGLV